MKRIISAMITVLILLTACGVQRGSKDAVILTGDFLGEFNPLFAKSDGDLDVCSLIFDSLVEIGETGDVISSLADWEVLDEGLRYRFKIQRNAAFSDGSPLCSEDVLFTMKLLTRVGMIDLSGAGIKGYSDFKKGKSNEISGFELSDDNKSFSIILKGDNKNFLKNLTFGILSREYYESTYESEGFDGVYKLNHKPVGSGQYILTRYEKGVVTLTANEKYFKGVVGIEHLTLKSGKVKEFDILETYQAGEFLKDISRGKYLFQNVKNGDFYVLGFNCDNDALKNADVRRSIKMATDREKISESITGGFEGVPEILCSLYSADIKKAEGYMNKAGYKKGGDGIYEKNNKKLTFKVLMMQDIIGDKVFSAFKEDMKKFGIEILEEYSKNPTEKIKKSEWDLYLLPLRENSGYLVWDAFKKDSDKNIYSFENSDFDKLKENSVDEMQKIISEEVPVLPLYEKVKTLIYHSGISGVRPSPYRSVLKSMFRAQYKN